MQTCATSLRTLLSGTAVALTALGVQAGRPLAVDDANVNEPGHGQVEAWLARSAGVRQFNVAPAYAPADGFEISALLAQDGRARQTLAALQAKWRITPSQPTGCNLGAVAGAWQASGDADAVYAIGLLTCNAGGFGSLHANLGATQPRGESSAATWGLAYEREIGGVTPHVEWFGASRGKPTIQAGLRGLVAPQVQLDGSVGRSAGQSLFTVGLKYQF